MMGIKIHRVFTRWENESQHKWAIICIPYCLILREMKGEHLCWIGFFKVSGDKELFPGEDEEQTVMEMSCNTRRQILHPKAMFPKGKDGRWLWLWWSHLPHHDLWNGDFFSHSKPPTDLQGVSGVSSFCQKCRGLPKNVRDDAANRDEISSDSIKTNKTSRIAQNTIKTVNSLWILLLEL